MIWHVVLSGKHRAETKASRHSQTFNSENQTPDNHTPVGSLQACWWLVGGLLVATLWRVCHCPLFGHRHPYPQAEGCVNGGQTLRRASGYRARSRIAANSSGLSVMGFAFILLALEAFRTSSVVCSSLRP